MWGGINLLFQFGNAQSQHTPFYFHHISQADGLSQTTNNVIFKDSRGFVWISSLNGLHRYDGRQVKVYKYRANDPHSLPDNYIQSRIIEDSNHDLWFSTYEALVRYDRRKDHFESYRDSSDGQPLLGYHLTFQTPEKKLAVVVGGEDLKLFDPGTERWVHLQYFPSTMYRVIPAFDQKGGLKGIITGNYDRPGIHFYDFGQSGPPIYRVRFNGKNEEPALRLNDAIWLGDTLLVATKEGFLTCHKNGDLWSFHPTPDWQPNKLSVDENGEIMVSLNGGGWLLIDQDNIPSGIQHLHHPNDPLSLSSNNTNGIWMDNDGCIWTGVTNIGVDFTQPKKVKFRTLDIGKLFGIEGRPIGIHSMEVDAAGNIWCSSRSAGVFVLSANLRPLVHFSRLNPDGHTIPTNDVPFLFFDKKGRCWAISFTGLSMKKPEGERFELISIEGLLYGIELMGDKGLLFTTLSGGITRLKETEEGFHFEKIPHIDTLSPFTHLYQSKKTGHVYANKNLQSILVLDPNNDYAEVDEWDIKGDVHAYYEEPDSDTIWIGTKNGLTCLNQKDTSIYTTYTEEDGLPDQEIYAIIGDDSTLWLTTNRGMVRFFKKEKRFHTFDLYDGLQGLEFNSHGFMQRNGEIWFAGQRGVNYFKPSEIKPLEIAPQVQITGIWVNDEQRADLACIETGVENVSEIKRLRFEPHERKFRFEFAALEFSNPERNTFRYKLEGYDQGWSQWTRENFAIYNRLPPGDYTLLVSAANSDGYFEAKNNRELKFTIKTPFWQQWWFIVLAILTLLSISYAVYRYRLAQFLRIERLRNQISTDLHDDIGATLSNLNILTTLVRQKLPADSDALPLLTRIEEEVSASAESLDDIIWSINPKNDPLDRVLARMRRFASEVFEAKGIEGVLDFPRDAKRLRLDMGKRRQFYLLFKEAVNNLAKYANCKKAGITVAYQNGLLTLQVRDDGRGFDVSKKSESGNGLSTMRQRATNLKGKLQIISAIGEGTSIQVVFPITEIRD